LKCYASKKIDSGAQKDLRAIMFVCLGLVLLVSGQAHAKRIYKSVDAEGNITYSSTPPENARQIEKLDISGSYQPDSSASTSTAYDEIKAAADELEKDRKQREKERENARIKQQQQEANKQAQQPVVEHRYYYPAIPLYHHHHRRHPTRPIHRPRPHHPPRPELYPNRSAQKRVAG
jgi:hypothetical protein